MLFPDGTHDEIFANILFSSENSSGRSRPTSSMLFRRRFSRSKSSFPIRRTSSIDLFVVSLQMAFFVLGNFISNNEILYEYVDELTPFLVQALNDTISKIRSHAVSKSNERNKATFRRNDFVLCFSFRQDTLGFLARHRLSDRLIELKVPEKLLDVACHDTHVTVQEFALRVLKQMLKHPKAKEVKRVEKLDYFLIRFVFSRQDSQ